MDRQDIQAILRLAKHLRTLANLSVGGKVLISDEQAREIARLLDATAQARALEIGAKPE